ncbi:MAG: sulfotransferase family protein, partial [Solirubrobacteraceae bacterium]
MSEHPPPTDPAVIVAPPASGGGVLAAALVRAAGVWHLRDHEDVIEPALPALAPGARGWRSHELAAADAAGGETTIREAVAAALVDREGQPLDGSRGGLALLWDARQALRIRFLDAVFPRSRFVLCARDPAEAAAEMLGSWRSGRAVTISELPGWPGARWSLPLIDGWRELAGRPLEEVVVEQWSSITERALADLEALAPDRWAVVDFAALIADPAGELRRVCGFLGIGYDQALRTPVEEIARRLAAAAGSPAPGAAALDEPLARARAVHE